MGFGINAGEFVVLLLVIVLVAGPERLPEFAQQLGRLTRELKKLAVGARERAREEFGPEFDDLDLAALDPRQYDPRRIVREALLDDEPPRARPRPRADRRGTTAPRPAGSTVVGGTPPASAATPAAPAFSGATSATAVTAPGQPGQPGQPGTFALSEPSAFSGATAPAFSTAGSGTGERAAASAARLDARGSGAPRDSSPATPRDGAETGGRVAPLSAREIVARTRGVRPAYESAAVVAALWSVGITPEDVAAAAPATDPGPAATSAAAPTDPAPAPTSAAAPSDPAPAAPAYRVPFDDEAT